MAANNKRKIDDISTNELDSDYYNDLQELGLSLYEIERPKREKEEDGKVISLEVNNLNKDLTCPICLSIIRKTLTAMECLHRFCSDCINKCLRIGNPECPTCRSHLGTRRNLRPDPVFDKLISALYPNLDQWEEQEEDRMDQYQKNYTTNAPFLENIQSLKNRQSEQRRRSSGRKASTPKPAKPKKANKKLDDTFGLTGEEISFTLVKHPKERFLEQLERKYIKTSRLVKVEHLLKYLAKQLKIDDHTVLRVTIKNENGELLSPLHSADTLNFIEQELWHYRSDLSLIYWRQ